jgi:hypothetical protein
MSGFLLRVQLAKLAQRHRTAATASKPIALAAPVPPDHTVILRGLAATDHTDQTRMKFAPFAIRNVGRCFPPLLHRHSEPAGEITSLQYDPTGTRLSIACNVTHDAAKTYGGFSVAVTIEKYELHNVDSKNYYALVTSAVCNEISLTPDPVNPYAVVTSRTTVPPSPHREFYDGAVAGVTKIMQIVDLMKQQIKTQPPPARRPQSDFSRLVSELNNR